MPDTRDIRSYLEQLVEAGARAAVAAGDLPDVAIPGASLERPKDPANGDFASTLPLRLARAAMQPPIEVARAIATHIPPTHHRLSVGGYPGSSTSGYYTVNCRPGVEHIIRVGPAFAIGKGKEGPRFELCQPYRSVTSGTAPGALLRRCHGVGARGPADCKSSAVIRQRCPAPRPTTLAGTALRRYQQLLTPVGNRKDGYPGEYMIDLAPAWSRTRPVTAS